jgi:ArsR family transcriptional regulator, arsenate/arsenite/antimonite-responsive transcriptional repressor
MARKHNSYPLQLLFRALADPTRLRLLNLIGSREICVCYLVEILGISQPKISRHLAYLRRAGIAIARREGRWIHYRLIVPKDDIAASILRATMAHLEKRHDLQQEIAKLQSACCTPEKFDLPKKVPLPSERPYT